MPSAVFLWNLTVIGCLAHSIKIATADAETRGNSSHMTCKDLNYQEQFCNVTDPLEWNCLEEKAVAWDRNSCISFSNVSDLDIPMTENSAHEFTTLCSFYEVCAFTEANFKCSDGSRPHNYTCTSPGYGMLNCTINNQTYITKNCTPSLIHCDHEPNNWDCYDVEHDSEHGKQLRGKFHRLHYTGCWNIIITFFYSRPTQCASAGLHFAACV